MGATQEHIKRAEDDEKFYHSFDLTTTPFMHWAVTSLFYSALHYVDACLHEHRTRESPHGYSPATHPERTTLVSRHFRRIYASYRELKDESENARYNLKQFTTEEVNALEAQNYSAIRSFARNHLSSLLDNS